MNITGISNLEECQKALEYMAVGLPITTTKVVLEVGGDGAVHTQAIKSMRVEQGVLVFSGEES